MNNYLIEYHNSIVKPEDTVYIIGDFSINPKAAREITQHLNGKKILICGNHDAPHWMHKKSPKMILKYLEWGFEEIHQLLYLELKNGQKVVLSHLPYAHENNYKYDDRYKQFRIPKQEMPLLCGHVHEAWLKLDNQLNVGWDAHKKYLSEEEVIALINDPRKFIPVKLSWKRKIKEFWKKLKGENREKAD